MRALRIHEAATDEAAEAAAWYEKERPRLGTEFEHAVDAALDLLEEDIVPLVSMPGRAEGEGDERSGEHPHDRVLKARRQSTPFQTRTASASTATAAIARAST
jgi:hypothetical protein